MNGLCSVCQYQNPEDSTFCIRCSSKLAETQGAGGAHSHRTSSAGNAGQGYSAQGAQAQNNATTQTEQIEQMGKRAVFTQMALHAFAGRGEMISHQSWLLYAEHLNAAKLRTSVKEILSLRNYQSMDIKQEKLQENGYWTEERNYITIQRGVTTVFAYVAPAGQDIYISRATAVRLPLETLRIVFIIMTMCEVVLGIPIMGALLGAIQQSLNTSSAAVNWGDIVQMVTLLVIVVLAYIPSLFILVVFLMASFKHWLSERDFWVYLRRNKLQDFEMDDVMLLEHATDEAVLGAVKQLGLDATKITPPVDGYKAKRRVRLI